MLVAWYDNALKLSGLGGFAAQAVDQGFDHEVEWLTGRIKKPRMIASSGLADRRCFRGFTGIGRVADRSAGGLGLPRALNIACSIWGVAEFFFLMQALLLFLATSFLIFLLLLRSFYCFNAGRAWYRVRFSYEASWS